MSKYLRFELLEQKLETKVIEVITRPREFHTVSVRLGIIKWYNRWRQYAFFPESGTLFNVECLEDIQSYIKGLR
jgi:hypothetical protein